MIKFFFIIIVFFSALSSYSSESIYKKALNAEKNGNKDEAVKYYREFLKDSSDKNINEKIYLRIARLSADIGEAVKNYQIFFDKFPGSSYYALAKFECAGLYRLSSRFNEAVKEYSAVAGDNRQKEHYRRKAKINIAEMEIELEKFSFAAERLFVLLQSVKDYEDSGKIYYLLGYSYMKQGFFQEAEKFFLTSAGSYPLSTKSASSLYMLVKIYQTTGRVREAQRVSTILKNLYPDSIEAKKSDNSGKNIDKMKERDPAVDLIELNKDVDIANDANLLIDKDFSESIFIKSEDMEKTSGDFYIQLGYFSEKENAEIIADDYKKKGASEAFIARTRSHESSKIFYRLLIGPYKDRRDANKKIVALKEKNIESILLELVKNYE